MLENATTSTPMNREFSVPDEMVYNRAGPVHWIISHLRAALRIEPQPYSKQATQKEVNLLNSMVPGFALMFGFFMVSHWGRRWSRSVPPAPCAA